MLFCYHVVFDFPFCVEFRYKFGDIFKQYLPLTYICALQAGYQEVCLTLVVHFPNNLDHTGGHAANDLLCV